MGKPDDIRVELVVDARAAVGEGPMWDARDQTLWWVDIGNYALHRFDPATGSDDIIPFDQPVTAVAPRESGGLIAAVRDGFAAIDPRRGSLRMIAEIDPEDSQTRMNDGRCDPSGRFWAGSMTVNSQDTSAAGSLYCLYPDLSVHEVLSGMRISNGIDWSLDGGKMYFIDTLKFSVDEYHFMPPTGTVGNRRTLISFDEKHDPLVAPDGLCVDSQGCLWIALWGGSSVRRFSPKGEFVTEVRLPVTQVTSCTFGGASLSDLYITTASEGLSFEELQVQPHAGGIYRCRPGVRGRPVTLFAG